MTDQQTAGAGPVTVAFHVPHLNAGGIERVVLNLLINLDRALVRPVLICTRRTGTLMERVPADVPVIDLGGAPARRAAWPLAREVRRCGARILYSGTNAANMSALVAGILLGGKVRVVPSEHTAPRTLLETYRYRRLRTLAMRLLYPRAAAIAVPVQAVGDELRAALGLPDLPIMVQPNPVLDARFEELSAGEPEIPLPDPGTPLISATGRLDPAKGFDDLIRAMALLRDLEPPPHLIIMGDGELRAPLEAQVREAGLGDMVTLAGHVANPYPVMKRSALAVMSSRWEGFGNVLIEAMACGTPVVSTDCPVGPRVILEQGKYGRLVPVDDPAALAAAMREILTDPDLARAMAAKGLARAADYGISRTVGLIGEQFAALAAGRPWPGMTSAGDTSPRG